MPRHLTYNDVVAAQHAEEAQAEFVMDEDAFRGFYDRNARSVWAYLARITGDRHTADDLLQETFYRFLRANAAYEGESHRRHSLYRIATNLVRDAQRRGRIRGDKRNTDLVETLPAAGHNNVESATDLTRAMSHLKPREREMLWLAYAEGASHAEIAETLGLRSSSMKALLSRARHKLAHLLRGPQ